jgi:hypothetical protein
MWVILFLILLAILFPRFVRYLLVFMFFWVVIMFGFLWVLGGTA